MNVTFFCNEHVNQTEGVNNVIPAHIQGPYSPL